MSYTPLTSRRGWDFSCVTQQFWSDVHPDGTNVSAVIQTRVTQVLSQLP